MRERGITFYRESKKERKKWRESVFDSKRKEREKRGFQPIHDVILFFPRL